ncbi:MAG: transposase [Methanolinea sp.]|nr:transposase [Methanolinea sp.]
MHPPLVGDRKDPKWFLLERVLELITSRPAQQVFARNEIEPIPATLDAIAIVLTAMFFSCDCSFVIQELVNRRRLRKFLDIRTIPTVDSVYKTLSRFDETQFISLVNGILNSCCTRRRRRGWNTFIVDATAITLDLNWFRKKYTKKQLENRDYAWGYCPTHGHYIGYKLTLALDAHSLRPVCFLLHPGSPHDSTIFREIVSELKRRRIVRIGDTVVFDKGYDAYDNYVEGIFAFSIVPMIFTKKNFSLSKLLRKLNFPLWIFGRSDTKQLFQRYTSLARRLVMYLRDEIQLVEKRSLIEDVFKMAKNAFGLKRIHKYTTRSVKKTVCLNVLLLGLVISLGFGDKIQLQRLAEW